MSYTRGTLWEGSKVFGSFGSTTFGGGFDELVVDRLSVLEGLASYASAINAPAVHEYVALDEGSGSATPVISHGTAQSDTVET